MADLNLQVQEQESSTLRMLQEKAAIAEQMDDIRMQQATCFEGGCYIILFELFWRMIYQLYSCT
jgi:hypothetical protein